MLKNNRGVTMLALVTMIILIGILSSVVGYTAISNINTSRYYNAISEMKIMQAEVNVWYERNKDGQKTGWDKGGTLLGSDPDSREYIAYNSVVSSTPGANIGPYTDYRYFSKEDISKKLDIEGVNHDFIININTRTVILIDGAKLDNSTIHYALCQIPGEQFNVDYLGH